jgi:hypothetical protein
VLHEKTKQKKETETEQESQTQRAFDSTKDRERGRGMRTRTPDTNLGKDGAEQRGLLVQDEHQPHEQRVLQHLHLRHREPHKVCEMGQQQMSVGGAEGKGRSD